MGDMGLRCACLSHTNCQVRHIQKITGLKRTEVIPYLEGPVEGKPTSFAPESANALHTRRLLCTSSNSMLDDTIERIGSGGGVDDRSGIEAFRCSHSNEFSV